MSLKSNLQKKNQQETVKNGRRQKQATQPQR